MVTAIYEAVANAIDHAYGDGRRGAVRLTAQIRPRAGARHAQAVVTVRDWGRWKPSTDSPRYRGHGLTMMNGLMDGVEIRTIPDGTEVVLTGPVVSIDSAAHRTAAPPHGDDPAVRLGPAAAVPAGVRQRRTALGQQGAATARWARDLGGRVRATPALRMIERWRRAGSRRARRPRSGSMTNA